MKSTYLSLLVVLCVGASISCGDDPMPDDPDPPVEAPGNCDEFCAVGVECFNEDEDDCLILCGADALLTERISEQCFEAFSDSSACVGGLTCEELTAWSDMEPPEGYPCEESDRALDEACN